MKNLLIKKPLSEKVAEAIAKIAYEIVMIFLGLLALIGRLLYTFRKWEWRLAVVAFILYSAYTTFPFFAEAPKAQASFDKPYTTAAPAHVLTHEEIVLNARHGDIIYRIWSNETSQGTSRGGANNLQVYCEAEDMTNEFGFNPYNHQCFQTFQDAVDTVSAWWDDCLQTRTLQACLLRYSGNSDNYVTKFLNK